MSEPKIVVNGYELSLGQAMTMRVALETFSMTLSAEGLGSDQTGKAICAGYLARADEIRKMMFERQP